MDLLVAWLVFPALMLLLSGGCGALVERLVPGGLPTPLLPVVGFAAIVVVGQFLTLADAAAELTAPVVVVLAVAGLALGLRRRRRSLEIWAFSGAADTRAISVARTGKEGDRNGADQDRLRPADQSRVICGCGPARR